MGYVKKRTKVNREICKNRRTKNAAKKPPKLATLYIKQEPLLDDPEPSTSQNTEEEPLLTIKRERVEEVFVKPVSFRNSTKPEPSSEGSFCSLCLRQCTEEQVQQFSPYQCWNGSSVDDRREKLEQVLGGGTEWIGKDGAICRTCWSMVEMVVEFRLSCLKMVGLRERFPFGVGKDDGDEEWFAGSSLDGLMRTRKMVQDHVERVEMQEVEMRNELDSKEEDSRNDTTLLDEETSFTEDHFEEDVGESSKESTKPVENSSEEPNLTLEDSILMPLFPCSSCNRSFESKNSMLIHQNYCNGPKPENTRKFSCTICSADFLTHPSLVGHMNKHKGIKPFHCSKPGCNASFYSSLTRRVHEQGCGSTPYVCSICGVSCKNISRYKVHQASHEEPTLSCPHCDKKFTDGTYLKRHQKVHTNARNYPCTVCGKAYKTNYAARVHMRIHTQEKPFSCTVCGMGFAYKCLVKPHMEKNHAD